jgi:hypothetical protein
VASDLLTDYELPKTWLVGHLPYEVKITRMRLGHHVEDRWAPPEAWCVENVGEYDQDWVYMGLGTWRFREKDQAVQFELTWS